MANSVEDTGDVYFVPAFTGLFAPHWRSDARGLIIGMTQFTTRAHICRALLEAVCFQVSFFFFEKKIEKKIFIFVWINNSSF